MHAKSLQLCPTLCDPLDYSPPASSLYVGFSRQYWSRLLCPVSLNVSFIGKRVLYLWWHLGSPMKFLTSDKCSSKLRRQRFTRIESNKILHMTNTHKKFFIMFMWTFAFKDTCMWQLQNIPPGPGGLITATNQLWDPVCPFHLEFRWPTCKMNELS